MLHLWPYQVIVLPFEIIICGVNALATETLQQIFLYCLDDEDDDTLIFFTCGWKLGHVSRRWRDIIANTPAFWTTINLSQELINRRKATISKYEFQLTEVLACVRKRTKEHPVSIGLSLDSEHYSLPRWKILLLTLFEVFDPKLWRSLSLTVSAGQIDDFHWVDHDPFVNLETLDIDFFEDDDGNDVVNPHLDIERFLSFIGSVPRLKQLEVLAAPEIIQLTVPWGSLTYFSASNLSRLTPNFLSGMANLEWLELLGELPTWNGEQSPNLSRLHTLRLCSGLTNSLTLPSLRHLSIQTPDIFALRNSSLQRWLPQIQTLELVNVPPIDGTILSVLEMLDSVEMLKIHGFVGTQVLNALKARTFLPKLQNMDLVLSPLCPTGLYPDIKQLRGLQGTFTVERIWPSGWGPAEDKPDTSLEQYLDVFSDLFDKIYVRNHSEGHLTSIGSQNVVHLGELVEGFESVFSMEVDPAHWKEDQHCSLMERLARFLRRRSRPLAEIHHSGEDKNLFYLRFSALYRHGQVLSKLIQEERDQLFLEYSDEGNGSITTNTGGILGGDTNEDEDDDENDHD
ncbi:hypothetical protein VNI00_017386 [Paramarasmius palmivorus]|uniref:F-box domain-containing protein n=1 Tax=Paramarasmius palmivorus TaxID=297713 RepID=A0AAW0B5I1_9AGAR